MLKKKIYIACLACCLGTAAWSQKEFNPIIPDNLADPSVVKFGDTFYLYGTTDIDQGLSKAGTPVVWKSKDFVNWSFDGSHIEGFNWKQGYPYTDTKGEHTGYFRYWAPGKVITKDGQYYLYVTFVKPDEDAKTYVLLSENPEGPFRFAGARPGNADPLSGFENSVIAPDIDGEPFIDDDGRAYLFWRRRHASRMQADWLHLEGRTVDIRTARQGYSEGPVMFKRKGIYYYIYTLRGNQNYANAYMMSRVSPLEGFERPEGNDIFLFSSIENNVWGPGHGNVFYDEEKDNYYFVYLEYGDGGTTRQVFVNRMEFNDDGTIRTLIPDRKGVGYLREPQDKRENLALQADFRASSVREPRSSEVVIETRPNSPLPDKASEKSARRTRLFEAALAGDDSNGTCWRAAGTDGTPWIMVDLKRPVYVDECRMAFVHPAEGHCWHMEKSLDGENWEACASQKVQKACSPHIAGIKDEVRYLRLTIDKGAAGLWEWKIFR